MAQRTSSSTSRWTTPSTSRRSLFSNAIENSSVHTPVPHSARGFYGRTIEQDDTHWQPGEVIVSSPVTNDVIDELKRSMHSLIADMQASMSAEFQSLQDSVCALQDRVQEVETQLVSVAQTPSSTASSGSEMESSVGRRKRRIPLEVQVCTV